MGSIGPPVVDGVRIGSPVDEMPADVDVCPVVEEVTAWFVAVAGACTIVAATPPLLGTVPDTELNSVQFVPT